MTEKTCDGFHWIGQTFASCDNCGRPYWEHSHVNEARPGAGPFDPVGYALRPISADEAEACRRRWEPAPSLPHSEVLL